MFIEGYVLIGKLDIECLLYHGHIAHHLPLDRHAEGGQRHLLLVRFHPDLLRHKG
ncbi:hypothetical protein D3C78_1992440 [compost metagenome]